MADTCTLCWNCKRATCPDGLSCPWAAEGKFVEGWKAEKGILVYGSNRAIRPQQSYVVLECPLYEQDKPYDSYADFVQEVVTDCNRAKNYLNTNTIHKLKEWERTTGKKVPEWIWYYYADKKNFKGCDRYGRM